MGATRVVKTLWVGSAPDPYAKLEGFDVLVLAAEEFQPSRFEYFRGQVLRCGIDDTCRPISAREKQKIRLAARRVADHLYAGDTVLCTCMMGWNRSSLVAACALKLCTTEPLDKIVEMIRDARGEDALSNESFVDYFRDEAPPA